MSQNVNFSPIRNPANPERVFVYRVAPTVQTLGYDQRTVGKGPANPRWNKDPTKLPSTRLLAASNIVTLNFDDVVHVYGVAQTSTLVSLLSPFTEVVGAETKAPHGALAGCAVTEGDAVQAWLAYQGSDGTKEPLMWTDVTDADAQDKPSTAKYPMSGTALSVFHDTKRYWLIYQNDDGKLVAQNEKDQIGSEIHAEKSNFIEKTPIGTCFIPGYKEGTLGRAIVYWVRLTNQANVLYRSHADITDAKTATWSDPKPATSAGQTVQPLAQIGVITENKTKSNWVYVAKEGKDNITAVSDPWQAKEE
ncbi:hypothetical protein G647_04193 [Cladophialophora carrionii CBS 160.54]|uniref:Fucose-specific lectin n=1 Tax=Cladophialophora carrionii CBS 160.54 TaxID=1279043 RepID=V9DEQ6_9EURO|nr:uncharacterized protein G647_04193 [Cladophialophora carrionii CBS 160.54]ETI24823.1 hypothetical protein G647_04193 [Cladophialophora carrionii CBS 160.54]